MSTARRIGVGLVGCGHAAVTRHLPALASVDGVRVVALADPDRVRLERTASRFGIDRGYADAESLVEDPRVEAVGVCVPARHHAEIAIASLAAGKHVLVEKPIALSLEDAERMAESSRAAGTATMVAFNLRFHRQVRRAREAVLRGALGSIELVRSVNTSPARFRPDRGWAAYREDGGGSLLEAGVHHYDLWRLLTGSEVEEVFVSTRSSSDDDDGAAVAGRLSCGALVSASFSNGTSSSNTVALLGERGSIDLSLLVFDGFDHRQALAVPGAAGSRARRAVASLARLPDGVDAARRGGVYLATYHAEWEHFVSSIRRGTPPESSFADGIEALRVALTAVRSATAGLPVRNADAPRTIAEALA